MRFRYGFGLTILLSVTYGAQIAPVNPMLSDNSTVLGHGVLQRIDAGVELIYLTPQKAQEMDLVAALEIDPGFTKWCILFRDIPDGPPYSFEQKRVVQPLFDHYYPCPGPSSEDVLIAKTSSTPAGMVLDVRGYLLGEKVTLRLSAKNACKEIEFYPRPLFLKKATGEVLLQASIVCAQSGFTAYILNVCGVGAQEKYKLTSYSGKEILSHDLQGPKMISILPEVVGQMKGTSQIVLQLEDKTSYTMELPWGHELLEYICGNK